MPRYIRSHRACVEDNLAYAKASRSYISRFGQDQRPQTTAESTDRRHVNRHPDQPFQFQFDPRDVKQGCRASGINQKVDVAVVVIVAASDRTEDARVACLVRLDNAPY